MTTDAFNELVKLSYIRTDNLTLTKGQEYGQIDDRLHNFDTIRQINSLIKEDKLLTKAGTIWTTMAKQLASVIDMINGDKPVTLQMIEEKFGDVHVYLLLLEAQFKDIIEFEDNLAEQNFANKNVQNVIDGNAKIKEANNFDRITYMVKKND